MNIGWVFFIGSFSVLFLIAVYYSFRNISKARKDVKDSKDQYDSLKRFEENLSERLAQQPAKKKKDDIWID